LQETLNITIFYFAVLTKLFVPILVFFEDADEEGPFINVKLLRRFGDRD